ncbi:MAG TPA: MarR family transcriptional regulator, partial [Bryobacteraceae bacterium]|nr:MarR family transcriptional regulator [Bryobacteraceae bacterium]
RACAPLNYHLLVAGRILQELQQSKPFEYIQEEAFVGIYRTADVLMQDLVRVLRPHNLSLTQYNILRILRGAGSEGVNCKDIANRMVTRDPDVTRLLDRLETRGLLSRGRTREDKRFVSIQITEVGLSTLESLDAPIRQMQLEVFRPMKEEQVHQLVDLLEILRSREPRSDDAGTTEAGSQ